MVSKADFPRHLECPITFEMFNDPVITKCGHTFNSTPLLEHLAKQKACPTCKRPLSTEDLIPNIALREQVEAFRTQKALAAKKKLEEIKL